jgi:hypothetical protein
VCASVLDGVDDNVRRLVLEDAAVLQDDLALDPALRVLGRLHVNLETRAVKGSEVSFINGAYGNSNWVQRFCLVTFYKIGLRIQGLEPIMGS